MIYTNLWQGAMAGKARKRSKSDGAGESRTQSAQRRSGDADVAPSEIKKASLFMNGRSQAVRLPKEFRFEGTHVYARKEGDRVILSPTDDRWENFLAAFGAAPDFPDRDQGEMQKRPELDALSDVSA